jgi:hypothetical protein
MFMPRDGMIAGSTLLLAAVLAGCSDQSTTTPLTRSPAARSSIITPVTQVWDFAAIQIPGVPGPVDDGTSHTFAITGLGSIVASSPDRRVTNKGGDLGVDASERGLGLCLDGGNQANGCVFPTDGDEVGDPGSPSSNSGVGTLLLNFNGVLPAGSMVTTISLGSVQTGEGYRYSISTNGGTSFTAATDVFPPNDGTDITTLAINLPAANLVIKFEKTSTVPTGLDDDYTVRTVTTSFTPPSTIWCSPGFWKNHGRDLWTGLQSQKYNALGATFLNGWPNDPQSFFITAPKKGGSTDPTLIQVIDNPQQYGGPATNNVADYLNHLFFGTPFSDQPENCPDVLPFVS